MNVNNRKLFANRDARRRLAEMGGIVGAYPELLGVAQQFNLGGRAQAGGTIAPVYTIAGGTTGTIDPSVQPLLDQLGIRPEDFAALSPSEQQEILNFEDVTQPMRETAAQAYEPYSPPQEMLSPRQTSRGSVDRAARLRGREIPPPQEEAEASTGSVDRAVRRREAEAAAPQAPDEDTPRPMARPESVIAAAEEAMAGSRDPQGAAAGAVIQNLGGEEPATTVEGRIAQYERLFQNMFGESDEARAREQAMNLAMIGFAIASGEDPSALRNISTGLLQGTAQMREDAATRRQREDRIRELAVSAGIEDDRLAHTLAGRLSEAALSASGRGTTAEERLAEIYDDGFNAALEAALSADPPLDMAEGETPVMYARRTAGAIQQAYRTSFGEGGDEAAEPETGSLTGATPDMTEEERALFEGL